MTETKITQYLGIPYLHEGRDRNGLDCYGLVCMFYRENFDTILPDYTYNQNWQEDGLTIIQDEYWKMFDKIETSIKYCAVTFRMFGSYIERHIGIMLDDISFMHVPINGGVCIEKLTNRVWGRQRGSFYKLSGNNGAINSI